jgi:hypothetical protein
VNHFAVPVDQAREALAKALRLQTSADCAVASAMNVDAVETIPFFQEVMTYLQPETDA